MTKGNKKIILPVDQEGEVKMSELICDWCNVSRVFSHSCNDDKKDVIRGVLTCRNCKKRTIFGMTNDAISFYPTKNAYGQLSDATPDSVRGIFLDAELCFYGMGFRGAAAMCRACVERALIEIGITKGKLEVKIEEAKKQGKLTDREHMLAHGSRLVGNDAVHEAETIEPSDIPTVLSATRSIVSHLFP